MGLYPVTRTNAISAHYSPAEVERPLRVTSVDLNAGKCLPLYPDQQTISEPSRTSLEGQKIQSHTGIHYFAGVPSVLTFVNVPTAMPYEC